MRAELRAWARPLATLASLCLLNLPSFADEVRLRGGGTIHGVVVADEFNPGSVLIYTAGATVPLSVKADRVQITAKIPSALDEYLERRSSAAETAEDQLALAQWCDAQKLRGPAQQHYARVIELDPANQAAHEKLGHVLWDGRWMTYAEVQEAQGLVLYKGKWETPEGKEELEAQDTRSAARQEWLRRVRALVRTFQQGNPTQRAEAERQLRAIGDPNAIVPLVNVLGHETADLRLILQEVIGAIDSPQATAGLVHRLLHEPDDEVRRHAAAELVRRQDPSAVPRLVRALDDRDPERVGRAATALGALGIVEAVPRLIAKLVSQQRRLETVMVPAGTGGPGGGGIGVGFSSAQGVPGPGSLGFYSGPSIPVITGPAVAPGAIAFGVTAVPFGATTGLGVGAGAAPAANAGGMGAPALVPRQVWVPFLYQNVDVLAALELLSGENFGYDVETWRRWLRTDFRPPDRDQRPERRVPQP